MAAKTQISVELERRRRALRSIRVMLDHTEDQLLWTLLRYLGDEANSYRISVTELANDLHRSESTVKRAMRRLERIGFIARTPTISRNGRQANEYSVMWGTIADSAQLDHLDREAVILDSESHCDRDEFGRWTNAARLDVVAMTGVPLNGHERAIGTDNAGQVNLTDPVRSNRPIRSGQFDRSGQVNLTGPSLFPVLSSSESSSPPPSEPRSVRREDVDWVVVLEELEIFGCLDQGRIREAIYEAKANGTTPQTVRGLIRHAAGHVLLIDEQKRPIGYWEMPSKEALERYRLDPTRAVYRYPPQILLWRIRQQRLNMSISDRWWSPTETQAEYQKLQARWADYQRAGTGKPTETQTPQAIDEHREKAEQLTREREVLELAHGAAIEDLSRDAAIALLPDIARPSFVRSGDDPRTDHKFRLTVLRAFAANVATPADQAPPRGSEAATFTQSSEGQP